MSAFGVLKKEVVTYAQAHLRLKRYRGRPTAYLCASCSQSAREWAYMGGCPDEITDSDGLTYSLDMDRYEPMCTPCHRRLDRATRDGRSVDVCPRGHLWSENTVYRAKRAEHTSIRYCRTCHREQTRERRARLRAEAVAA